MRLKYGDRKFMRNAKKTLRHGGSINICFYGWRAKFLSKKIPLLKEIQRNYNKKPSSENHSELRFLFDYLLVNIFMSPFMVIFWLAVAQGRGLRSVTDSNELVEIAF